MRRLSKEYQVHVRAPGVRAALTSLFRRRYISVNAIVDVSFHIDAGERVGFLGLNGAGKTTTLKVLAGLLYPTAGEVIVGGHLPHHRDEAFLKQIALVTGQRQQLIWDLPPIETFELNRAVYDLSDRDYRNTLAELNQLLDLGDLLHKPTRQLSLGERMKCELAAALLHRPRILFLDEPTIGLDVAMQVTVREFIKNYSIRWGATVLLTSHDMNDISALCPRVLVMSRGRLSFDGSVRALSKRIRPEKRVTLHLREPVGRSALDGLGCVVRHDAAELVLQVPQNEVSDTLARVLARMSVSDLTVEDPPLEEIMRAVLADPSGPAQDPYHPQRA